MCAKSLPTDKEILQSILALTVFLFVVYIIAKFLQPRKKPKALTFSKAAQKYLEDLSIPLTPGPTPSPSISPGSVYYERPASSNSTCSYAIYPVRGDTYSTDADFDQLIISRASTPQKYETAPIFRGNLRYQKYE